MVYPSGPSRMWYIVNYLMTSRFSSPYSKMFSVFQHCSVSMFCLPSSWETCNTGTPTTYCQPLPRFIHPFKGRLIYPNEMLMKKKKTMNDNNGDHRNSSAFQKRQNIQKMAISTRALMTIAHLGQSVLMVVSNLYTHAFLNCWYAYHT